MEEEIRTTGLSFTIDVDYDNELLIEFDDGDRLSTRYLTKEQTEIFVNKLLEKLKEMS